MAGHNDLGKLGEEIAIEFLRQEGYSILETNWFFDKAEIDIIARKGNTLSVVEVKTRSSEDFGLPHEFVNHKKIRLLVKAVDAYVIGRDLDVDVRFDIIGIHKVDTGYKVTHLADAFFYF